MALPYALPSVSLFFFSIVGVLRFRQRLTAFLAHIVHLISHALFLTVIYALAPVASTTLQRASRREYKQWLAMTRDLLAFMCRFAASPEARAH